MPIAKKMPIAFNYLYFAMILVALMTALAWGVNLFQQQPLLEIVVAVMLSANVLIAVGVWFRFHRQISRVNQLTTDIANSFLQPQPSHNDLSSAVHDPLGKLEVEVQGLSQHLSLELSKTSNKQARVNGQLLSAILDSAAVAVYAVDSSGTCIYANPQCAQLLGYQTADELLNANMRKIIDKNASQSCLDLTIQDIKEDTFWRADGTSFPVEYKSQPLDLGEPDKGAVISFYDNSERLEAEALIRHQAHYDTLTDLPNRFLALKRLEQLVEASERNGQMIAVIFLDLDDFKKINDSLGHEAGDQLLITASERLLKATRAEDTVGRLGGDEFIILLDGLSSANDAQPLAENLIAGFRKPFYIDNRQLILTASIGIAIYPNDGKTPSELLRNADSAMYHTKSIGRNTYSYFTHAMNKEVSRRLAIEEQIHGALERDELSVHYQIQLDIRDGTIMGAEALLRWDNPTLGSVSPAEFIPIAEQTGVIESMGEFIIKRSLEAAKTWQHKFNDSFRIAINLSPRQFRNPNLVQSIKDKVSEAGMTPADLELEITEGVLLSGHAYTLDALMQLSKAGFCISMDDFGTGYSSLSYLRTYPFKILKIDRSFINDMNKDDKSNELIIATIEMAHALGIQVIAEGVETQEQLDELSFMMCDYAQGFLISKPAPFDDLLLIGERYKALHQKLAVQEKADVLKVI
ncbi:putative bifunctional diguanylate cyclase/phosphodiesterase [Shewanella halifaxensis]|uniref:putative bifunctional diguanylate cyclase/phosphodiesterase n=1 Tax=Shewanella halifaxensis TaxID=271098 RepID=UPI000D5908A0|nr:EAL domain-containing protein [Shewanella halifaxensis]